MTDYVTILAITGWTFALMGWILFLITEKKLSVRYEELAAENKSLIRTLEKSETKKRKLDQ